MAVPNARINDFLPERYAGYKDYAMPHWLAYMDYCDLQGLNAVQREARFKTILKGPARLWIEGKHFANVDDLKGRFLEYFSRIHERDTARHTWHLMKYKVSEIMEEYVSRLHPLAARLGYDDLAISDEFLAGLPEKIEEQVSMAGGDLANAIQVAQKYANLLESRQTIRKEVTFLTDDMEQILISQDRGRSPQRYDPQYQRGY